MHVLAAIQHEETKLFKSGLDKNTKWTDVPLGLYRPEVAKRLIQNHYQKTGKMDWNLMTVVVGVERTIYEKRPWTPLTNAKQ